MERFFKLRERGTTVKTEFIAGMTTFFAMVYILMVNANMFADPFGDGSNPLGVSYGAMYIATPLPPWWEQFLRDCSPISLWRWQAAWASTRFSFIPLV